MNNISRRALLASAALSTTPLWARKNHIGRDRISTITDENAKSPAEAIAFAKQYGLQWVELRNVPGEKRHYIQLTEAELKQAAADFKEAGLRVSFLNSGMLKFTMPGTEQAKRRPETPEAKAKREASEQRQFDNRIKELDKAILAAHILGVNKIRIFAFMRVADPMALLPKIAEVIEPMVKVAEKQGVQLLLENEGACNVGTCAELAAMMKLIPNAKAFNLNWDPLNAFHLKEEQFPFGYSLLPKKRIQNVQIKGKSILATPEKLDWADIFTALEKDGYQGQVGLECHIFERLVEASHESMKEILRICEDRKSTS